MIATKRTSILWMVPTIFTFFIVALLTSPSLAETPLERAGKIKEWKKNCNDPDIDLRTAYIEAATQTNDRTIQRICITLALQSEDLGVQNLGLRSALASLQQIRFDVSPPSRMKAEYDEAGEDEDKKERLYKKYKDTAWHWYQYLRGGMVFRISKQDFQSGTAVWHSTVKGYDEKYNWAQVSVIGNEISWAGFLYSGSNQCNLRAILEFDKLVGIIQCGRSENFPISAQVF